METVETPIQAEGAQEQTNQKSIDRSPSEPLRPVEIDPVEYATLKRELDDLKSSYARMGLDPTSAEQVVTWARQVAQAIQEGRLKPVDQIELQRSAQSEPQAQARDTTKEPQLDLDQLDALDPKEQLRVLSRLASEQVRAEAQNLRRELEAARNQQMLQLQLAIQSLRMAQEHGVPFNDLIVEATKLAAMTPDQLLQAALEAKLQPKRQKEELEKLVAQEVAKRMAEIENRQAAEVMPMSRVPRWAQPKPTKTENPFEERMRRRLEIIKAAQAKLSNSA